MIENIKFISTNWSQHRAELIKIRSEVFIDEQKVPAELEWDEFDSQSIHFLTLLENKIIATARLKPDGQIGRMAVIKEYRHKGVGTRLFLNVLQYARKHGFNMIYLHIQKQAVNFYKQFDLIKNGNEFMDANIPHQAMYKNLCS